MADEEFDKLEDFDPFEDESGGSEPEAKAPDPQPAPEPEPEPAPADAQPASQGDTPDATPASVEGEPEPERSTESKPKDVPLSAFLDVRNKLKESERRLRQFERMQEDAQAPDPDEDPEAHMAFRERQHHADRLEERIQLSREYAIDALGDEFEQMEQVFVQMAADDPALLAALAQASNPAKFAYEKAREHVQLEQLRDPSFQAAERERLKQEAKEEARKELLAEMEAEQSPTARAARMSSLATAASAGTVATERLAPIDEMTTDEVFDDEESSFKF